MRSHDLIRASKLGDYVYCKRSWLLNVEGVNPSLKQMKKRDAGIEYHQRHGEQVQSAEKLRSASIYVLLVMLFLALGYWLYVHFQ
ncbi:MAG: hypothetical protein M3Y27_23495 [Acidobacteriota bacterium]|nr:hypothetical protein [Acidobacteriota bacterium]